MTDNNSQGKNWFQTLLKTKRVSDFLKNKDLLRGLSICCGILLVLFISTIITDKEITIPDELGAIAKSIQKVKKVPDAFKRERLIQTEAESLKLSSDDYRKLFEALKSDSDILPDVRTDYSFLSPVVWFYQDLSRSQRLRLMGGAIGWMFSTLPHLTILYVGWKYLDEIPQRERQAEDQKRQAEDQKKQAKYQAWQVIHSAYGQKVSGARIAALEDLLTQGESLAGLNLEEGADLKGINLEGADLKGVNLKGADLKWANLKETNLIGANLEGADLREANLESADFYEVNYEVNPENNGHIVPNLKNAILTNAILKDVILKGVNLAGTDLCGANLAGADLSEANLEGAELIGANLNCVVLYSAKLKGANLGGAELMGANLVSAELKGAILISAKLKGAILVSADLEGAVLEGTDFEDADLMGACLNNADLFGANLKGTNLFGTNFSGSNLQQVHLDGAYLLRTLLDGVDLKGAMFDGAILKRANLTDAKNLSIEQLENTYLDETELPEALKDFSNRNSGETTHEGKWKNKWEDSLAF